MEFIPPSISIIVSLCLRDGVVGVPINVVSLTLWILDHENQEW